MGKDQLTYAETCQRYTIPNNQRIGRPSQAPMHCDPETVGPMRGERGQREILSGRKKAAGNVQEGVGYGDLLPRTRRGLGAIV